MGEALRKACPAIDLKQQVGNLDTRQRVTGWITEVFAPGLAVLKANGRQACA